MKRLARTVAPVIVALALVLGGSSAVLAGSKPTPAPVPNAHGSVVIPVTPGPAPKS